MNLTTLEIKPSFFITIDKDATPIDCNDKNITFFYIIGSKKIIIEGDYSNKDGNHYWPYTIIDPHEIKKIYKICIELFDKMKPNNYLGTLEKGINLIDYFNVKTFSGAVRKLEFYSFNWNNKYGYYFCKGERNVDGYSWYRDYIIGDELTEEKFYDGYNKMLKRIEKKLLRKELKKNK